MKAEGRASFRLAFASLFVDKLFDLGLSGLLLLPTLAFALRLIDLVTCAALFVAMFCVLGVVVWAWYRPVVRGAFGLWRWAVARAEPFPWLHRVLRGGRMALREDQMPGPRIAAKAYGMTVLRYALMAARFAAVSQAVGINVPPLLIFVGIPIAQLGLLLAVTPGALGAMEAGWLGVLLLAGLPRPEIATFLIAQRTALTVFISSLGALSWVGSVVFPFRGDDGRPTRGRLGTADDEL
jgi:uncharacterized membrane protein YbhN (UPF0104 family)